MRFPFLAPFLTASLLLSSCGGSIGGPKYSLDELRAFYGDRPILETAASNGNLEHIKSIINYDPSEREIGISYLNAIESNHEEVVDYFLNNYPETMYWYRNVDGINYYGLSYALFNSHYQLAYYMINNYRDFIELDESLEKATLKRIYAECNVQLFDTSEDEGKTTRNWLISRGSISYGEGSDKCDFLYDIIYLIDDPSLTVASLKEP